MITKSMVVKQPDSDRRHQLIQDIENVCEENGYTVKFYLKPDRFDVELEQISAETAESCDSFIILVEMEPLNILEREILRERELSYKIKNCIEEVLYDYLWENSQAKRFRYYRKCMRNDQYTHSPTIWRSYPIFKRNKAPPNHCDKKYIICIQKLIYWNVNTSKQLQLESRAGSSALFFIFRKER